MSKGFFVGARVRIKWSYSWPGLAGMTGVIYAKGPGTPGKHGNTRDWMVKPDCWPTEFAPAPSTCGDPHINRFAPNEAAIEPLTPDGARAGTMTYRELMDSLSKVKEVEPV